MIYETRNRVSDAGPSNHKHGLFRYGDFYYTDKTGVVSSYLYNVNFILARRYFYSETTPWFTNTVSFYFVGHASLLQRIIQEAWGKISLDIAFSKCIAYHMLIIYGFVHFTVYFLTNIRYSIFWFAHQILHIPLHFILNHTSYVFLYTVQWMLHFLL